MFDIKEYFHNRDFKPSSSSDIDDDISFTIESLLDARSSKFYLSDIYRDRENKVEIISPSISYTGNRALIPTSDRIRFLLSFYPHKRDFKMIQKIVIRPRYFETGNTELLSLYLRKQRTLVLYLSHPHSYEVNDLDFHSRDEFISVDLEKIRDKKLYDNRSDNNTGSIIKIHPLWYFMSVVSSYTEKSYCLSQNSPQNIIDKFFIRNEHGFDEIYNILNDISFFYSRHGY